MNFQLQESVFDDLFVSPLIRHFFGCTFPAVQDAAFNILLLVLKIDRPLQIHIHWM
jgi:hypothetical protein